MKVVRFVIALLLFLLCGLAYWMLGGSFLHSQENNLPPDIRMVNDLTCKIDPQPGHKWIATGTAKYLEHDKYQHDPWSVKFPPRKSIEASAKDCDKWFQVVNRIQAATRPVDVNDLRKKKENP